MMHADHVNAFVQATKETFLAMCNLKVIAKYDEIKKVDGSIVDTDDLMAICGLSGEVKGATFLSTPLAVGQRIISAFLMEEVKTVNYDLMDGFGEIVNIYAGAADAKIPNTRIDLALPSVLVGCGTKFFAKAGNPFIIVPMVIPDLGPMNMGISMEIKK